MKRIAFLCMLFVLGAHLLSKVCAHGTEVCAVDTTYGTYDKESKTFTIKNEFLGQKIPMRAIADACEISYPLYGDYLKTNEQLGGAGKDRFGSQYFEVAYRVFQNELRPAKVVCDSGVPLMLDLTEVKDTAFKATLCFLGTKKEGSKGFVPDSTKTKEVSLAVESNTPLGGDGDGAGGAGGNQGEKSESSNVLAGFNTLLLLILLILQFVRKGKSRLPKAQQVPSPTAANMPQPQPVVSSKRNTEYQQLLDELGALKKQVATLQQGIQQMHVQQQQQHVQQQQQHVQQQQQQVQPLPPTPPTPPTPQPTPYEPEEVFDKVRYVGEKRCLLPSENSSSIIRVIKKGNDIRFTLKDEARQGILSNLTTYVGCIEIAGNKVSPTQLDKITPGKLRQEGNCYVVVEPIILHCL